MMLELAFTVCLMTSPEQCEDRSLLFAEVSVFACIIGAQPVLASWSAEHPRWRIDSYRCRSLEARTSSL